MSKKERGQFFSTNYKTLFSGFELGKYTHYIEPFAGNKDLTLATPNATVTLYDIEPTSPDIVQRDTLLNPPDYTDQYVITNPPYLARNKTTNKEVFNKYGLNDLYKCFIQTLIHSRVLGGVLILPINFFCSNQKADVQLRVSFLELFHINRINLFEYQVFDDTSSAICVFEFRRGAGTKSLPFHIFTTPTVSVFKQIPIIDGCIFGEFNKTVKSDFDVHRLINKHDTLATNIIVKCVDDSKRIHAMMSDKPFYDETTNKSERAYCGLAVGKDGKTLSSEKQVLFVEKFNRFLEINREKYHSLFLASFRENTRKRISFEQIYQIAKIVLVLH